jgi:hypothetical protein
MEQEQGWDPEIKEFFKKIMSTITYGILWLAIMVTAGIYFRLAWDSSIPLIYRILFYVCASTSFFFLLRYYYRTWRK